MSKSRRFIYLALGVALIIFGNWIASLASVNDSISLYLVIGDAMSGFSAYFWLQIFLPTELRENGMIFFGSLVKWSRIKSYEWKSPERLLLRFKPSYLNWQRKWTFRVPSYKREKVEQIFEQKIPL